jgi:hypothetical protein
MPYDLPAVGAIDGMFNVINGNLVKDPLILAKQNFILIVLSLIGLFSPCISFYLCTLSCELFQLELLILFHIRQRQD